MSAEQPTGVELKKEAEKVRKVTYSGDEQGYLTKNGRYSRLLGNFYDKVKDAVEMSAHHELLARVEMPPHYELLASVYKLYFEYSANTMQKFKKFVGDRQFSAAISGLASLNSVLEKYLGKESVQQWKDFLRDEPELKSATAVRMSLEPVLNAVVLNVFEQQTAGTQYNIEQLALNAQTQKEKQRIFELLAAYAFDQRQIPFATGLRTNSHLIILLADLEEQKSVTSKKRRISDLICSTCANEAIYKCGGCMKAKYCSPECRQKDWPEHQKNCEN